VAEVRVLTVAGTRPELIRLSLVIPRLDKLCDHVFVHTGQNWDPRLKDIFFRDLDLRQPDRLLGCGQNEFGNQVAEIMSSCASVFREEKPDRLLILGDTNSALCAFVAKRMGIKVFHMEAGNRCYDDRVPEEVNRRVIDACSDVLMPYTQRSAQNLLEEGYPGRKIQVTGNPIWEVLKHFKAHRKDAILDELGVDYSNYFLATVHRAENVDDPVRLAKILKSLQAVQAEFGRPVYVSTHPRTRDKLEQLGMDWSAPAARIEWKGIHWLDPLGFHDFVRLEESAFCVLTDSGTVQEECCLLRAPAVTLRDTTERPETVECGSNMLAGVSANRVVEAVRAAVTTGIGWAVPEGYEVEDVSRRAAKIVVGHWEGL
jgi:UDP-N-acetylglucosamine 2-epimerase (non-hydrolysing)